MENTILSRSLGARAAQALGAMLALSSSVKLLEVDVGKPGAGGEIEMLAHVGVLGHKKLLACKIKPAGQLRDVAAALDELRCDSPGRIADATPVLVAPSLSLRAQQLCTRCCTSYLDFEGNGKLELGDMFICGRSLARNRTSSVSAGFSTSPSPALAEAPKIPPVEVRPAGRAAAFVGAASRRA
jgi:hypothetical protein